MNRLLSKWKMPLTDTVFLFPQKIQQALQGISEDIDQKLTDSNSPEASSFTKGTKNK